MTGILSGLQPMGNISFRFAILISGYPSNADSHAEIMKDKAIKNVPSLHVYGTKDTMVTDDRTLQLAAAFENPTIVSHPGGHFTPNTWPKGAIQQFLLGQQQHRSPTAVDQRPLTTFAEKIEATILFHHQCQEKKCPATPVGLSTPLDVSNLDQLIDECENHSLADLMLLIWCERRTFHNAEPDETSPFFRHWILLYLKKPAEVLSSYLALIPKYGSWSDLKTLYTRALQMSNVDLDRLKSACVELFAEQLKRDHRLVLNQPDESSNDREEQQAIQNEQWISNCAKEAPRISSNPKNVNTGKSFISSFDCLWNRSFSNGQRDRPTSSTAFGFAVDERTSMASRERLCVSFVPTFDLCCLSSVGKSLAGLRSRTSQVSLSKGSSLSLDQRTTRRTVECSSFGLYHPSWAWTRSVHSDDRSTLTGVLSVVPCALEDLQPLLEHLAANRPGPSDEKQPVVFSRGTLMSGGRLDLCKQVVGPQGIQPLLNAMKNSAVVNRLLLGNNIVGLPGAQGIAEYIRNNADSQIDTWYIAGNNFDGECMSLICDALAKDTKVKALWLKRNPILASGTVHIARMLRTNHYLETLDLLNTGLLDDGCRILFDALKVNRQLKHLYIDTNGLTVKSGRTIRSHFEENDNRLESLYLSCNALGDAGVCEIAAGLKADRALKRLGLASNCIGVDGARALVAVLVDHPALEQLNLGFMKATILLGGLDNVIGDEGATEIARLIQSNSHLRSIDLTFNGISQRGLMKLRDALKNNRTLTTLKALQFGQVHSDVTKEEINTLLETNKVHWGREILGDGASRVDCLEKGQQLNDLVNFPDHVMEIISYYRTHWSSLIFVFIQGEQRSWNRGEFHWTEHWFERWRKVSAMRKSAEH